MFIYIHTNIHTYIDSPSAASPYSQQACAANYDVTDKV